MKKYGIISEKMMMKVLLLIKDLGIMKIMKEVEVMKIEVGVIMEDKEIMVEDKVEDEN
jgi:hypothetical protein